VPISNGSHVRAMTPKLNPTHATHGRELQIKRHIAVFYEPPVFPILHYEKKLKY